MKIFKVAIIGCGNIFPTHAESIKGLENTKIVAVCDVKKVRAMDKAKQYDCNYYTDYKEMLSKEEIDVVHICLPHYLHAEVSIYASNQGKHVLTEKPMSIKLSDAQAMIKSAKDNNYTYDSPVEIELHCEKGIATMVGDRAHVKLNDGREFIADTNTSETFSYGDGVKGYWGVSHTKQIKNYYSSISAGLPPDINGEEAIKTQKMVCGIYESGTKRVKIEL